LPFVTLALYPWRLHWIMIAMGLLAGGVVLLYVPRLSTASTSGVQLDINRVALPSLAIFLVMIGIWFISRIYRSRRDQPIEEFRDRLILDHSRQVLKSKMGEALAQVPDVQARMQIEWWTRGPSRIVVLSWPGGRRTVYRTFGRRPCLEFLEFLNVRALARLYRLYSAT